MALIHLGLGIADFGLIAKDSIGDGPSAFD
jgi:hypothetical protein